MDAADDLWVFGYGSLMWRPGFPFEEKVVATLHGHHRALCVYSTVHRGTPEKPGLVMGLDRGGSCRGVAFRVAPAHREATLAYLREREQVTMVYREARRRIRLVDGRNVTAVTYTADRAHKQYAGRLPHEELLRLVLQGVGISGANPEYVMNTYGHIRELGLKDAALARLVAALGSSPA